MLRYIVGLLLGVLFVQAAHFAGADFRQDEVYTAYFSRTMSPAEMGAYLAQAGTHPLGWRVLATEWLHLVGTSTVAARWSSVLATALALAFTYRLAADLFGRRAGLISVIVLGFWPFAAFYLSEFRPYPLLIACTAAANFAFARWLRRPNFTYALLYVGAGVLGVHTHYYMIPVVAAHALVFMLVTRFDWRLWLRGFTLFALVALSLSSWFAFVALIPPDPMRASGLTYAYPSSPVGLYFLLTRVFFSPGFTIAFAGLVFLGVITRQNLGRKRPKRFVILLPLVTMLVVFIFNAVFPTLTPRNITIALVPAAVLAGLAAAAPSRIVNLTLVLLMVFGTLEMQRREVGLPLAQIEHALAAHYQPGTVIVVSIERDGYDAGNAIALHNFLVELMQPSAVPNDVILYTDYDGQVYSDISLVSLMGDVDRYTPADLDRLGDRLQQTNRAILIHLDSNAQIDLDPLAGTLDTYFAEQGELPLDGGAFQPDIGYLWFALRVYSN